MKTLYFDCFCGASGDMIIGALLDAGADFTALQEGLSKLDVAGYTLTAEKRDKHGVAATQFDVHIDSSASQPHRHLRHIIEIIEGTDLPAPVRRAAVDTFRRIAEAEAEVHGTSPEKVHFHEVGAIDSIVDVVGAHLALYTLGIERIVSSPLHVGAGTVKCAHGIMPVPAPATALLLKGAPVYGGEVAFELVTPTGAALVTQLAESFGPLPEMRLESVGCGSGKRDLEDRPNVLRALIGECTAPDLADESIVVMETNIDDMNPELLPPLIVELLDAGARDAFLTPIVGKKGRPAHVVTVLCEPGRELDMTGVLLRGTSTLGIRMRTERRVCLAREWRSVNTPWGEVRIKVGRYGGAVINKAPEFEDCLQLAEKNDVPVMAVYQAAAAAAMNEGKEYV